MITYSDYLKSMVIPEASAGKPIEFPKIMEEILKLKEEETRQDIKEYLEKIDLEFKNSPKRKENYYIKYTKPKTLITMAGEITITRTIYKDRLTDKPYYYLEEKLGIRKRQRYTNDVACSAYEAYADENSMIKVGIEIGNIIHSRFSLDDNRKYAIPRATIANMIKRVKTLRIRPLQDKKEINELYILIDEKYLPDHPKIDNEGNKAKNSTMVKAALITEGLNKKDKHRHKYINPQYYSSYNSEFSDDLIEYLDGRYDLDKIKRINVLADGANWIKTVSNDIKLPGSTVTFYLDKFHFSKALWRVCKNDDIYSKAINYLYHNDKNNLYEILNCLNTDGTASKDIDYIKHNYKFMQNTIHLKNMNCAMEQCISHHIASQFSSVPKVYSKKNINIYLSMRDNYRNKENLKLLYLEGLNDISDSEITTINKLKLDQSIFNAYHPLPYYTTELLTGKKPILF